MSIKESDQLEGSDPIIEFKGEIRQLEREIFVLNIAIDEGVIIQEGLKSDFWRIQERTFDFLTESYLEEAFEAARTPNQSSKFFLGRIAHMAEIRRIMKTNFVQGKDIALKRREACQARIQEINDILDKKSNPGYTGGQGES